MSTVMVVDFIHFSFEDIVLEFDALLFLSQVLLLLLVELDQVDKARFFLFDF